MILLASILWSPTRASLFEDLSGTINVSGVDSKSADETSRSLSQQYSAYWTKDVTAYLQARASMRYFDFGVDHTQGGNSWRREYQPRGELFWKHPDFSVSGSLGRQVSTSNARTTDLVRDQAGLAVTTRVFRYPVASIKLGLDRTVNERNRADRDTRQRRAQLNLNYSFGSEDLYYSLAYRLDDNYATTLKMTNVHNLFRWNHVSRLLSDRLRLNAGYNFSHRYQKTDRLGADSVYLDIPVAKPLYAWDQTPEFDSLGGFDALADGNTTDPTSPGIDIGAGSPHHNIGVDFGYEREVNALYIYTDRPSGAAVNWDVYVSIDNLTWTEMTGDVTSRFNNGFNRYEIVFDSSYARYVKAVNDGDNDVSPVYVTEVQALSESRGRVAETRQEVAHTADLGVGYMISSKLESSASVTLRKEPRGDFSNSHDQVYSTWSLKYTPVSQLTQIAGFQAGLDDFKGGTRNGLRTLSYTVSYTPLTTLQFSFAAASRSGYIDRVKTQEINSLLFRANGRALPGLTVSGETVYSRNNRFDARSRYDTRSYRISTEATFTRSITTTAAYAYQATRDVDGGDLRLVRTISGDVDCRLTRSILVRASFLAQREHIRHYYSQDYIVSWAMSRKLTVGAAMTITDGDHGFHSERNSVRLSFAAGARTNLYATYNNNELSPDAQTRVTSVQVGLNSGF